MVSGHSKQVTKQIGEYLVAAELCRRDLIATTFTGNVPNYDILAADPRGSHLAIQVKAINRGQWQFDATKFVEIEFDGKRQVVGKNTHPPYPGLICVLVALASYGHDRFFILEWSDLQRAIASKYRRRLKDLGGVRPRKPGSFHTAIALSDISSFQDNWGLIPKRLKVGV